VFHVVIGCIHEINLSKTQTLRDGRDSDGVCEIEYQLVTLPRFTSLLHGYDSLHCTKTNNSRVVVVVVVVVVEAVMLMLNFNVLTTLVFSCRAGF